MKKVSVTYHAPKGDSKVATIHGYTFFDGKAEEIEVSEAVLAKFKGSTSFSCGKESDVEPGKHPDDKSGKAHA